MCHRTTPQPWRAGTTRPPVPGGFKDRAGNSNATFTGAVWGTVLEGRGLVITYPAALAVSPYGYQGVGTFVGSRIGSTQTGENHRKRESGQIVRNADGNGLDGNSGI